MDISGYIKYITQETMMGPNCVRLLAELLDQSPLGLSPGDLVLDLGCGKGLTSLVIAKETGARVCANDLWISAEENGKRFAGWGVSQQVIPVCEDANHLHFEEKQFGALVSIDSYHYFGGREGFFQDKILPFMKDGGTVLIGVPGLKDRYTGRAEELLSPWLGKDAYMFQSPARWKELMGGGDRIDLVKVWKMACFDEAWSEWLGSDNPFAREDKRHFETVIRPYTCLVGILVKLK